MIYPWQQQQYQQLLQCYKAGTMSHALLLSGSKGLGKMHLARHLAQALLCEGALMEACEQCDSCGWFDSGSHPDLLEVTLEEKSQVIKIDQVRSLTEKLYKTTSGPARVVLISPADQLNPAAANALLKTLEEPPAKVFFVLLAVQPDRLPATILSRCQHHRLQVEDRDLALKWLQQSSDHSAPQSLLNHAFGAPLVALELAAQSYLELRDKVLSILESGLLHGTNLVPAVPALLKQDPKLILRALTTLVCDMIKIVCALKTDYIVNQDCIKRLQGLSNSLPIANLMHFYSGILQANSDLKQATHFNMQLLLEALLLQWMQVADHNRMEAIC